MLVARPEAPWFPTTPVANTWFKLWCEDAASYGNQALPFHDAGFPLLRVFRNFQPLAPPDGASLVNWQIS